MRTGGKDPFTAGEEPRAARLLMPSASWAWRKVTHWIDVGAGQGHSPPASPLSLVRRQAWDGADWRRRGVPLNALGTQSRAKGWAHALKLQTQLGSGKGGCLQ